MSAIAGAIRLDDDRSWIAADARLDEREALARELSVRARDVSDADLIRRAYARWGDAGVEHLLGDFAFVLWDGPRRRLLAARDPAGVRPLHYHLASGRFVYATHARDLFALGVPRRIDEARVADALVPELEGIDHASTFFQDVRRLPPAHRLVLERGGATLTRHWSADPVRELRLRDDAEYIEGFRAIFRDAVACRLDPGTAAMLSGGLDSSAIVGMARTVTTVTTVSAVSPDGVSCEETAHVRAVLGQGGLVPVLVRRGDPEADAGAVDRFLDAWAEPFDATMVLPVLVYAAAARAGASAVLDGVDGDAVASLEPDYVDALLRNGNWGRAVREIRGLARFYAGSGEAAPRRLALGGLRRAFAPARLQSAVRRARRAGRHARSLEGSLIHPDLARRVSMHDRLDALASHRPAGRSLAPRARQAAELAHPYLAAALERYHRAAASQGVEARHPFLDRRLVEFCLALPWDQKVRDGWSKWVVRRAMDGHLPDSVRWRRGRWVRLGPAFLEDAIASRALEADALFADTMSALEPFVDRDAWRRVIDRFVTTHDPIDGAIVWQTLQLARWLRAMRFPEYDAPAHRVGAAAPFQLHPEGPRA